MAVNGKFKETQKGFRGEIAEFGERITGVEFVRNEDSGDPAKPDYRILWMGYHFGVAWERTRHSDGERFISYIIRHKGRKLKGILKLKDGVWKSFYTEDDE